MNILALDTETGGIDPAVFSLLDVALVAPDGSTFQAIVRENTIVTCREALAVNKINVDYVDGFGQTPDLVAANLNDYLSSVYPDESEEIVLVGQNVYFDVGFLQRLYRLAGMPYPPRLTRRIMDLSSILNFYRFKGLLPSKVKSQSAAMDFFRISKKAYPSHTALGDARASLAVFNKLLELENLNV